MTTDLHEGIRADLTAHQPVHSLLGAQGNVFSAHVPTGTVLPYIVLFGLGRPSMHHLGGVSGFAMPLVQLECWAGTTQEAIALAKAVRTRLDGFRGRLGTIVCKGLFCRDERGPLSQDQQDASQKPVFSMQLDFAVGHDT